MYILFKTEVQLFHQQNFTSMYVFSVDHFELNIQKFPMRDQGSTVLGMTFNEE